MKLFNLTLVALLAKSALTNVQEGYEGAFCTMDADPGSDPLTVPMGLVHVA